MGDDGADTTGGLLFNRAGHATATLLLAHGAGAAMTSPFLETAAGLFAARGLDVVRFEFAYMAARRDGGNRRPPPRAEALVGEYEAAVRRLVSMSPVRPLLIGGKSLGGRVASLVADRLRELGLADGLVCLGYPFHPPAKPEKLRTAHLAALATPALIVQGERDPFGSRAEVAGYTLAPAIRLLWASDGDHDLGPRGASGFTRKGNLTAAADAVAAFAARLGGGGAASGVAG